MKTSLKNIIRYLTIITVGCAFLSSAQITVEKAKDFTATDIHGATHHLFEYLDADKYVAVILTLPG